MPPLTDAFALTGISLVLCAGLLPLLGRVGAQPARNRVPAWAIGVTALCFALLWWPVGDAQLPVVAYVRGISSDLSVTLVALAVLSLYQRVRGALPLPQSERVAVRVAVAAAALVLYPLALGWGDWDAYRLGWGWPALWVGLLLVSVAAWWRGLRLLPALVALALLGWSGGLLESGNLWDYLLDPWLAVAAIVQCLRHALARRRADKQATASTIVV